MCPFVASCVCCVAGSPRPSVSKRLKASCSSSISSCERPGLLWTGSGCLVPRFDICVLGLPRPNSRLLENKKSHWATQPAYPAPHTTSSFMTMCPALDYPPPSKDACRGWAWDRSLPFLKHSIKKNTCRSGTAPCALHPRAKEGGVWGVGRLWSPCFGLCFDGADCALCFRSPTLGAETLAASPMARKKRKAADEEVRYALPVPVNSCRF